MNIKVCSDNIIEIQGNIKSVIDYQEVKCAINEILRNGEKEITINLTDSISVSSSIIGLFLKLVYQDGITLKLRVQDDRLIKLIKELRLSEPFNIEKLH